MATTPIIDRALQQTIDAALALTPSAEDAQYSLGSSKVPASLLSVKHEKWQTYSETWDILQILYVGGTLLRANAQMILQQRPKEPKEIYQGRCEKITYQNIFGTICGWYIANLFKSKPVVDLKQNGVTLEAPDAKSKDATANSTWQYYADFQKDCDRNGTSLEEFSREVLRQLMVFGATYVLIDLPPDVQTAGDRAEQNERLRPYLCSYDPRSAWNWSCDEYGTLEWIVFYQETKEQRFLKSPANVRRWYYYDRHEFAVYEHRDTDEATGGKEFATLINAGPHACSDYKNTDGSTGRVPVIVVEIPDVLQFGERVHLQCRSHVNIDNSLEWGLMLGNLAMPVIKTDGEYKPTLSETTYIKLRQGDDFGWAEPSGRTFTISATRLAEIREEIYRAMYVLSQGRSSSATASASSGLSKQIDGAPATDIVNTFGDILRLFLTVMLRVIAQIRNDENLTSDVRGLNAADDESLAAAILNAEEMLKLEIPSETLRKELLKQVAAKYGEDWSQEIQDKIRDEIDHAPSLEEQKDAADEKANQSMKSALSQSASVLVLGSPTPAQPPKD